MGLDIDRCIKLSPANGVLREILLSRASKLIRHAPLHTVYRRRPILNGHSRIRFELQVTRCLVGATLSSPPGRMDLNLKYRTRFVPQGYYYFLAKN